ncbi:MAG: MFS transporter [Desulfotalea sp.]
MSALSPFKILCTIGLLAIFSSTLSKNPSLPLLITNMGGNQMAVGFIAGISALTGILFSFPAGYLSDRIGRYRMLLISGFVFATAPFLYIFATEVWQIGIIRFYHGLATAIFGPVAMAYVADLYQSSRGEKIGWFSTATLLGRFSAPALGGLILAVSASGDMSGFTVLYLVCGITGVGAVLVMYLIPVEQEIKPTAEKLVLTPSLKKGVLEILSNTKLMITCGVEAAILFAYGIFETFLPLRGINVGLSIWEVGLCISVQIVTIAISKPVLGRLSDRHGRPIQIIGGTVLAAVCMLLLAFSFSFLTLLVSSIFLGLSISIVTSASSAHIADLSSENNHGAAMGMLGSIMDIGHTVGPIVGGILAVLFSLTVSFVSGTVVLLLSLVSFIYIQQTKI